MEHVHVVTPTESTTQSNTIRPPVSRNKAIITNADKVVIDMDMVAEETTIKAEIITENDMNDTNTDTGTNTDGNKTPGLEKRGNLTVLSGLVRLLQITFINYLIWNLFAEHYMVRQFATSNL